MSEDAFDETGGVGDGELGATGSSGGAPSPTDFDWAVRFRVYETFAQTGRAPVVPEIAAAVGGTEFQVRTALQRLHTAHEIASLPDGAGVWMANPFSGVPTAYEVETPSMTCYAPCAWDAMGVPALLQTDGWIRTRCTESGEPFEFGIEGGALKGDDGMIHLVTPIRDAWIDIGFT